MEPKPVIVRCTHCGRNARFDIVSRETNICPACSNVLPFPSPGSAPLPVVTRFTPIAAGPEPVMGQDKPLEVALSPMAKPLVEDDGQGIDLGTVEGDHD